MSEPVIQLENVCVDYMTDRALDEISWKIPTGCHAAVLGPNGCGKSTLLRTITAYGHITSGTVQVLGETIGKTDVHQLRRRMGVVDPRLNSLLDADVTAQQLVATGFKSILTTYFNRPSQDHLDQAAQRLADVGLAVATKRLMTELSAGQKSRVWLARALINQPELLILDEPLADLDLRAREVFLATLDHLSKSHPKMTTLMVTHHLDDLLPQVSQIMLLRTGRIVASGSPESVLTNEHLSVAFDCPVQVGKQHGRWNWSVSPEYWAQMLE